MAIKEVSFPSSNGRDTVKGWVYSPVSAPRAIVQVVHGFGEHSRRYLHMIGTLLDAGFVVAADDHVAHGKTAADSNTWGDPGDKGFMTTVEDENSLRKLVTADYPDLPYFMFGHSWGSMIARCHAAHDGKGMAGLLLCGLVAQLKGADLLLDNAEMRKAIESGNGKEDGTRFQNMLFNGMTERYDDPKGPSDWIAADPDVVADHARDPFNNLSSPPTTQLIYDFVELYRFNASADWARKLPKDLPVYFIAGDQDPCCNYGEGLYHVANSLWSRGNRNVIVVSYTGWRHEIHNEPELREEVEEGIVEFIEEVLAGQ